MGHMWLVLQAAVTNNGQGISGMAPLASILPIRVLDNNGSGVLSDIYCKWYYPCS